MQFETNYGIHSIHCMLRNDFGDLGPWILDSVYYFCQTSKNSKIPFYPGIKSWVRNSCIKARVWGWSEVKSHSVMSNSLQPMDCGLPGSSAHGVLQARMLEWVTVPFSRESCQPRDQTQVSRIAGGFSTIWATREALVSSKIGVDISVSLFVAFGWCLRGDWGRISLFGHCRTTGLLDLLC